MDNNDPYNDPPRATGKRAIFAGMLIVLAGLVYILVSDIRKLPPEHPLQPQPPTASLPAAAQPAASETRDVPVGFGVGGRITHMYFPEHTQVKQGDILATLDPTPFQEALAAAQAQLQMAQAEYNRSEHLPDSNFHAIEEARANVETAQHAYDAAHAEMEKRRGLLVAGELDNVYADDVQNERDAELNLERTRRELAHEEDAAGSADRQADKAAVQAAEANLAIAQTNLADAELRAPVSGTIVSQSAEVGTMVAAGAPVYTLSVPKTP